MYLRLAAFTALIALAAILLGGATASAQTPTSHTLIKNTDQTNSFALAFNEDFALPFSTGTNTNGYKLTSVAVVASFSAPTQTMATTFSVSIRTGSGTSVGSSVGSLSGSTLTAGTNTFSSSSGIDLNANTDYFVVIDISFVGNRSPALATTASNNEDSGGEAGWSIGNRITVRNTPAGSPWKTPGTTNVVEMHIKGYVKPAADTPTTEQLLTNLGSGGTTNCPIAQGFTTGPGGATILEVITPRVSTTSVEIRANSSGSPSATALYTMTNPTVTSTSETYTAAAGTTLAASTTYWVVVKGSNCGITSTVPGTHPTWAAGVARWWNPSSSTWAALHGSYLRVEIKGTIHSGSPHEPERPEDGGQRNYENQPVTPKPFCNSSGRDPSGGTECYWRSYDQIPISDPCDQPWQVRGSYRHDRGCLNRY